MKKRLLSALFFALVGCNDGDNRTTGDRLGLSINTIDENNRAFEVQAVRWWYSGERNSKHKLKCGADLCAEWIIEEALSGSIVIHANTKRVNKDDESCLDLYSGEAVVEMPAQEVVIVVTYTKTACS